MRALLASLMISMAVLAAGCAASGSQFVKPLDAAADKARVYVFRPSQLYRSGTYPTVSLNLAVVGELKDGGFISFESPPGEQELKLAGSLFQWGLPDRTEKLKFDAGKTYYFRLRPGSPLEYVPPAQAQSELQGLRQSD